MRLLLDPLYRLVPLTVLSAAYLFSINAGVIDGFLLADYAAVYGMPYYVMLWVVCDARDTHYWPGYHYPLWLFVLGFILVPHYVIKTRGRRGLRLAVALSVALWSPVIATVWGWWFYYFR